MGSLSWPTLRTHTDILQTLVIAIGLSWSIVFLVVALHYELQLYADGAMFSYAVAVQDVWAFHWHNISARVSVFILTLLPAEIYVGLTGSPLNGIKMYGFLLYGAPLFSLICTFVADRSNGRIIFTYACGSTALLCPLIFGFPTEMWMAHALFWPALAISQYARRNLVGTALVFIAMLGLVLTHEGALVLAIAIVFTLALRGLHNPNFQRASWALIAALTVWLAVKIMLPPDEYFADALMRAALHFFDLRIFQIDIVLLLLATILGYIVIYLGSFAGRTAQSASLRRGGSLFGTRGLLAVLRSISARQQQILSPHDAGALDAVDRGICGTFRNACRRIGATDSKVGFIAGKAKE